jgi:hypothetical protein
MAMNGAQDVQVDPIRHVVVLMLENRSFDHILGGLQAAIPGLDGVDPAAPGVNLDQASGKQVAQMPLAMDVVSKTYNVPHEFDDVQEQLQEGGAHFVNNFVRNNPGSSEQERQQVMAYFEDGALPVTHALAKNYLVCNRWFSSLPGPTWPNRLFAHSGTCLGHVVMPSADDPGEIDQIWGTYRQDTIYNRLDQARIAGKPVSWRIYHDGFPQSVILDQLKKPFLMGRYSDMDDFAEDAKTESSFPSYVFIEPRYANGLTKRENDQHPPATMHDGELLIAQVYNAIRSNEALWKSTLLVLTYDEHGGFYDHVTPPEAIPPDGSHSPFGFDRFGVRVPTILISPFVRKGCDNSQYDHTSILRYLLDKYHLAPLGERTRPSADPRAVASFAPQILSVAREDTLPPFVLPQSRRGALAAKAPPPPIAPDNTRRALLAVAERMRVVDQLTHRGAALGAGATHLPSSTPTEAGEFAARMESVDNWLAVRSGRPAGIAVAPPAAAITIAKPITVKTARKPAKEAPPVRPPAARAKAKGKTAEQAKKRRP